MFGRRSARTADGDLDVPARPANVTLRNMTARRIGIAALDAADVELIVPPFGERTLGADELARHDYKEWEAHRLVHVTRDEQASGETRSAATGRGAAVTAAAAVCGSATLVALFLVAMWVATDSDLWALLALAAVGVTIVVGSLARWRPDVRARMVRSWAIFVVTAIAVGLPLWAAISEYWESNDAGLEVLLVVLVSIAAGLPGALYFLFQRQKLPTLRETFVRDLVRLDPNVQTTPDAENAYGSLIEEAYGSGSGGLASGRVPIFLTTLLLAGFWVWVLGDDLASKLLPRDHMAAFAFLGSYVFAVNMVFRRYTRGDLGPKAYTHIIVRTLVAVSSMWAVGHVPGLQGDGGTGHSILLIVAFFVGVVPETGTAVVQDLLQKRKILGSIPSVGERHPLSKLNGVSLYDSAHLLEAGIENVEGLAHHRMVDLMLWTRIPTSRLVDLVDQAILYLHVRGPVDLGTPATTDADADPDEVEDGARILLCRYGIRTATDLERAVARAGERSQRERDQLLDILPGPSAVSRLRIVLDAMEDDEWLAYVRNWRESNSASAVVRSVREFAQIAARESSLPRGRAEAQPVPADPAAHRAIANGRASGSNRPVPTN